MVTIIAIMKNIWSNFSNISFQSTNGKYPVVFCIKFILKCFVDIRQLEYITAFLSLDELCVYLRTKGEVKLKNYKVGPIALEHWVVHKQASNQQVWNKMVICCIEAVLGPSTTRRQCNVQREYGRAPICGRCSPRLAVDAWSCG